MNNKGFAHSLLLGLIALTIIGATSYTIFRNTSPGRVLGEDEESHQDEQKNEQEKQQETEQKKAENEAEQLKKEFEQRKESELRTSDGTVVKTKIEDDGSRKLELENKNGLKLKFEQNNSDDSTESAHTELETEDENENEATNSALVRRMINDDVIDRLASEPGSIKLDLLNGKTVYKVEGVKNKKVLGLLPVELKSTTFVSTESAQVISQVQSLWDQVLNLISF